MLFSLTDEEILIRDTARRIAAEKVAPLAAALDRGEGRTLELSISQFLSLSFRI
ncbi:MAG: hypothetical protein WCH83_06205 [Alphaproteobacteria bacterium]